MNLAADATLHMEACSRPLSLFHFSFFKFKSSLQRLLDLRSLILFFPLSCFLCCASCFIYTFVKHGHGTLFFESVSEHTRLNVCVCLCVCRSRGAVEGVQRSDSTNPGDLLRQQQQPPSSSRPARASSPDRAKLGDHGAWHRHTSTHTRTHKYTYTCPRATAVYYIPE